MKKSTVTKLFICAAAAAVAAAYLTFENEALTLTGYELASPQIPSGFDGFKIVHLSDIHVKSAERSYRSLLRMTESAEPDIIVISGDLIDHRVTDIPAAVSLAERLCEIAPVYYVTGNHEEALDIESYTQALSGLAAAGVQLLDSRTMYIRRGDEEIAISGLFDTRELYPDAVDGLLDGKLFNVFVCHRPQNGAELAADGVDLVLSGHAHGGQMRIPGIGGLIAPDQWFFPKYTEGVHRMGGGTMVVSRGIGNSLIPFRVNNRPEVVAITLKHE